MWFSDKLVDHHERGFSNKLVDHHEGSPVHHPVVVFRPIARSTRASTCLRRTIVSDLSTFKSPAFRPTPVSSLVVHGRVERRPDEFDKIYSIRLSATRTSFSSTRSNDFHVEKRCQRLTLWHPISTWQEGEPIHLSRSSQILDFFAPGIFADAISKKKLFSRL